MNLDNNNPVLSVAVVSSCQMVQRALQALCHCGAAQWVWQHDQYDVQQVERLLVCPTDVIILSLHVYQDDVQQGMRLIHTLRATHPELRLMVVLDVPIPFLVSSLQRCGVDSIVTLALPLADWKVQLQCAGAMTQGDNPVGAQREQLSPAESRVMCYLVQGHSMREIAGLTMRSVKTVTAQKSRAMHKMGIVHCAQLVAVQSVLMDSLRAHSRMAWQPDISGRDLVRFY